MQVKSNFMRVKRRTFFSLIAILFTLAIATPVLADYLGPDRTVTQTTSVCKVVLYECKFVPAKNDWRYKKVDDWSCGDEGKPWKAYPDTPSSQGCFAATEGDQYWGNEEVLQEVTITHPPATISNTLQNCNLNNGWCNTAASLALNGVEPLSGYNVLAIEGSLNGQTFGCSGANCNIPLSEGDNSFTYWALSSWGDSSEMGNFTAKVDTVSPTVGLDVSGSNGLNNWYVSPVSVTAIGSDATSGLQSISLSTDNITWQPSATLNDGIHTVVVQAQDNAGNISTSSTSISVDTITPAINLDTNGTIGSNGWYISPMNVTANTNDVTSGVGSFEVSVDDGAYQGYASAIPFTDGQHTLQFKVADKAGNITETSVQEFAIDTIAPMLNIPPSWKVGETITYTITDTGSGLARLLLVIEDAEGRYEDIVPLWEEAVVGNQFTGEIAWNGTFSDGTDVPPGNYLVWVKVTDKAGNEQVGMGRVIVPEPNPAFSLFSSDTTSPTTPVPPKEFTNPSSTNTFTFSTPANNSSPLNTSNTSFGGNVSSSTESTRQSVTLMSGRTRLPATTGSNLLWGATAAAMLGAVTAYALDEQRKRKEEEAQQRAQVQAEVDAKNAATQASLQARIESQKVQGWLEGQAILNAQIEQAKALGATDAEIAELKIQGAEKGFDVALGSASNLNQNLYNAILVQERNARMEEKMARFEAEEDRQWTETQRKKAEQEQRARNAESARWEGLASQGQYVANVPVSGTQTNPSDSLASILGTTALLNVNAPIASLLVSTKNNNEENPPTWWDQLVSSIQNGLNTLLEGAKNFFTGNSSNTQQPISTPISTLIPTLTPALTPTQLPSLVPTLTPIPSNPIFRIDGPMKPDQIPSEFKCTLPQTKVINGVEQVSDYYYRCKVGEQLMEGLLTDPNGWWWQDGISRTGTEWKGIKTNEDVWKLALTIGLDAEGTTLRVNDSDYAKSLSLAFRNKFWYLDNGALPTYSQGEIVDYESPTIGTNGRLVYLGSLEALQKRVSGPNGFITTGKLASEIIQPPFDGLITVDWQSAYQSVKDVIWPEPIWSCPPANEPFDFANPYAATPQTVKDTLWQHREGGAKDEIIYMNTNAPEISQWVYILTLEQKEFFYGHPILCIP